MLHNSSKEDLFNGLPTHETSGWKFDDGSYTVDWECLEIQKNIEETINFLTNGCSCKMGCQTNKSGCK